MASQPSVSRRGEPYTPSSTTSVERNRRRRRVYGTTRRRARLPAHSRSAALGVRVGRAVARDSGVALAGLALRVLEPADADVGAGPKRRRFLRGRGLLVLRGALHQVQRVLQRRLLGPPGGLPRVDVLVHEVAAGLDAHEVVLLVLRGA